jgi:hypothetical protein
VTGPHGSYDDLAAVLLGDGPSGYGTQPIMGMVLEEWNPTTYQCKVSDGAYTFYDCLVLHPSLLVLGRVAVAMTARGPLILGNSYIYTPTPAPEV